MEEQAVETTEATPEVAPVIEEVKYELKAPEYDKYPKERLDEIVSYAKERGLSPEVAQEIVGKEAKLLEENERLNVEALNSRRKEWVETLKSDKEWGGAKYETTLAEARRGLERVASEQLINDLKETGFLDYHELVMAFARLEKMFANDKAITPTERVHEPKFKSFQEALYKKTQEN